VRATIGIGHKAQSSLYDKSSRLKERLEEIARMLSGLINGLENRKA